MRAELLATADFGEGSWCLRAPGIGWLVASNQPELVVVNESLSLQRAVIPPSTLMIPPVIQLARSDTSNATTSARSSGAP